MGNKDELLKKLLATFKIEAAEHLQALSSGLLQLEKETGWDQKKNLIEVLLREAHTLKGAARSVNLLEIETLCHRLEHVFTTLKRQDQTLTPELTDLMYQGIEYLNQLLMAIDSPPPAQEKSKIVLFTRRLERALKNELTPPPPSAIPEVESPAPVEKPLSVDSVRIPGSKLNSLLLQAEEMLALKLTAEQRAVEINGLLRQLSTWRKEWSKVHPEFQKGRHLVDDASSKSTGISDFLEWNQLYLKAFEHNLLALAKAAENDRRLVGSMVDALLDDVKNVIMLPVTTLLEIIPKVVRDLSRDQNKLVELKITGGEIEVDRRILEEMRGPLIHLIRNCVDHGIEPPAERERLKKSPSGTITLSVSRKEGSKLEILISDDGAGIDLAKVKQKAIQLNLISESEAEKRTTTDWLACIFQSGISTSPIITSISGRGLGLAIVKEKIEQVGGSIRVETSLHQGTQFQIQLPVSLATFRGILIRVEDQQFIVPTLNVEQVTRIRRGEIRTVENRETIQINGHTLALVRLSEVLELPRRSPQPKSSEFLMILVLGTGDQQIAFQVDEVLSEQEVLVKSMGRQLLRVRNVAGATVLGSGQVVTILNVGDLKKSALKAIATPHRLPVESRETALTQKSILVVEDSITARTLVKTILESAGYRVKTAVDGVDALTLLKTETFHLVVSDIDMPRLNGLDLTARIRADKKLSALPVVLVTALEKREDRERGIEIGANAYIVKSSFDQTNLLEIVRQLI
ncbi:MAG: hybrid sensor histidine kinase/response regulator [Acidobacteria bacterium]|nr:hybrid sensor histidine kinase/response regulator [Acidobacteriota bacterium]